MPITCPNGHVNDAGNRFCDQCGAQLPAAPAGAENAPDAADATPATAAPASTSASASGSLACPTCGQENLPGTAFCENCGAQLPPPEPGQAPGPVATTATTATAGGTTCPNCGTDNEPGNSFCEQCGASLTTATPAPAPEVTPPADESGASAGVTTEEALPTPGAQSQPATDAVQPGGATMADAPQPALPPIPETVGTEATPPPAAPDASAAPVQSEAAAPAGTTCSNCGAQLPPNAKFCLECGTKVERQPEMVRPTNCQNCGSELPPSAKFCLECGTRVELVPAGTAKAGAPSSDATYQQQAVDAATPAASSQAPAVAPDQAGPAAPPEAAAVPAQPTADAGAPVYDAEGAAVAAAPVVTPPSAPAQSTPAQPPVQQAPAAPVAPVLEQTPAQPAQTTGQGGPRLISSDGTTISLPPQNELVIGREDPVSGIHPDIDMTPHGGEAGGVSRRHAILRQQGGQWSVSDLDSTNYTRVDGNRVAPNTEVPLHDGARIQFGRIEFEFRGQ